MDQGTVQTEQGTAREKILRAAMELISEIGAGRVTHRLVAERAEVSPGTTTYHFETLDALLHAAFDLYMGDYREGLDAALAAHPLETIEDVVGFLAAMTNLSPEATDLARLEYEMIGETQRDEALRKSVDSWSRLLEDRISESLKTMPVKAPGITANMLIRFCRGTELDVMIRRTAIEDDVFRSRLMRLIRKQPNA